MFQFSYDYNTALPTKFEEVAVVVHYAGVNLNSIFTKAFLQILYDLNKWKIGKIWKPSPPAGWEKRAFYGIILPTKIS